ncbi:uncharacterized protein LOC125895877 isoform X1 [Epinephelus fuscoguttatus]|uniref:uncharacterized protein LOC125895877 isoform X1 n=1 Tax=Epinephelus fuscoguttatus TaxID=293821 RepID=UPI0020D0B532|nr:uncharacterized protein LOC125895877 isoform X1 [Epinephelus fuscoguttatus]XP_049444013.1 uncharacterized protein LOC125895877 isoform X1 [Epinephelus fuscoguttatus]
MQMSECLVALGTIAAKQGQIPHREMIQLSYYKSHAYDDILVEGPGNIRLHGQAISSHCTAEGRVTAGVVCDTRGCTDTDTGHSVYTKIAHQWLQLKPPSQRKPRDVVVQRVELIRTTTWKYNLFYQWLEYSAKQVTNITCIACHRRKGLPGVRPLPNIDKCWEHKTCFTACVMWMAAGRTRWSNTTAICPGTFNNATDQFQQEFHMPPVVHLAPDLVFPFCVARGNNIEHWLENATTTNSSQEAERLIQCRYEAIITTSGGSVNLTGVQKVCNTTLEAKIQCHQVVNGGNESYVMGRHYNDTTWILTFNLTNGTTPLADIFWMCEEDLQVKVVLPANWTGICTPLMLTGQLTMLTVNGSLNNTSTRTHRSTDTSTHSWQEDASVYITWDQVPQGIPTEYQAISDGWIGSGRALGSWPLWGAVANAQYTARNSHWVNYLWYNQQRFVNWTIEALQGVSEQLHATSLMTVQNRLIIETMLAEDQGVCDVIGEHCCTVIPMHTGEEGNLTHALQNIRTLRDQHVQHSNWNTRIPSLWDWLSTLSPGRILYTIGMLLGLVVLALCVIACCILPLVQLLIKKAMTSVAGQFIIIDHGSRPETITEIYENMSGPGGKDLKDFNQSTGPNEGNQYEIMMPNNTLGQDDQKWESVEEEYVEIV